MINLNRKYPFININEANFKNFSSNTSISAKKNKKKPF